MGISNIISLAGGLGMFLYGIKVMGDGLEHAAGSRMKRLLEVLTKNRFLAVLVGFAVTAVIQSSSATTVMVVGFVNAGLMNLVQAIGVIMGANIGTTVTSILIALDLSTIAPIAILLGVLLLTFSKKSGVRSGGQIVFGFGLLFFGMSVMSTAMAPLRDYQPFQNFLVQAENPLLAMGLGIVMTAIIQSSSASIGILQALAMTGAIPLSTSIFVLYGQNIGTCVTAMLATIGAKKNAKRAALLHLMFNILGTALFMGATILLQRSGIFDYSATIAKYISDPMAQIAAAHFIFNIVSTAILLPLANWMVKMSQLIISGEDKGTQALHLEFIDDKMLATPGVAIGQLKQEVERMAKIARDNFCDSSRALIKRDAKMLTDVFEKEEVVNYLNHNITEYMIQLNAGEMSEHDAQFIAALFHVINDIERIGDHAINLAEAAQVNIAGGKPFSQEAQDELKELFNNVITLLDRSIQHFAVGKLSKEDGASLYELEEHIDDLTEQCQDSHIFRLNRKECGTEAGMLFLNTITDFERVADHAINIAFLVQ